MSSKDSYIQYSFDPYKWVEEGTKIASDNNLPLETTQNTVTSNTTIVRDSNKYGYKSNDSKSFEQQFDINTGLSTFLDQPLLDIVEENVQDIKSDLDLGGDITPAKLKFTSRAIGVFDFSQASIGLIRPVEYYSESTNRVIDSSKVFQSTLGKIKYSYYLVDGKERIVQKRQRGTTEMVSNCPELKVLKDETTQLYLPYLNGKVVNECKGYRLKYATTNKKVYAIREKKGGGIAPYVDLYFTSGENWKYNPEQMLISMMPNLMLARVLERSGVRIRIFCIFPQNIGGTRLYKIFMMKNYGETVDINKISTFTSDTRFFRYYMWNASSGWNFKMTNSKQYGGSDGGMVSHKYIERTSMPYLRNYVSSMIERGSFPSQVVDKRLMLFSGLKSEVGQKLNSDETKEEIAEQFSRISDYVQLQLSKTPNKVFKSIIKRLEQKGDGKSKIKSYLDDMITQSLSTTSEIRTTTLTELDEQLKTQAITKTEYDNMFREQVQLDTREYQDEILEERNKYFEMINKNLGL